MAYLLSAWKSFAIASAVSLTVAPFAQASPETTATLAPGSLTISQADLLPDADIVTVASSIDDFSTLVQAIETAGLADALSSDGPFTVFAPTNEAFADLDDLLSDRYGIGVADLLEPENRDLLTDVLTYHVVPDAAIASGDIPNGVTVLPSLEGDPLQVDRGGEDINVNSVPVTAFDVPATNGVIHVVDDVLLPPEVVATLEEARTAAEPAPAETTTTEEPTPAETTTTEPTPAETTTTEEPVTETTPAEPIRGLW
ncbi:MAG: fasciclin domain-containing protein [Cyanobacteria bacterium P01_D01_bin.71]